MQLSSLCSQHRHCRSSHVAANQVTGSTRDVEPLEYLVHMDHTFEFPPGSTLLIPPGKPGAGQTVKRGSYSTNGFSLIGLALAGGALLGLFLPLWLPLSGCIVVACLLLFLL